METTRAAALRAKERYFVNGKACRYGHFSQRSSRDGSCYQCRKDNQKNIGALVKTFPHTMATMATDSTGLPTTDQHTAYPTPDSKGGLSRKKDTAQASPSLKKDKNKEKNYSTGVVSPIGRAIVPDLRESSSLHLLRGVTHRTEAGEDLQCLSNKTLHSTGDIPISTGEGLSGVGTTPDQSSDSIPSTDQSIPSTDSIQPVLPSIGKIRSIQPVLPSIGSTEGGAGVSEVPGESGKKPKKKAKARKAWNSKIKSLKGVSLEEKIAAMEPYRLDRFEKVWDEWPKKVKYLEAKYAWLTLQPDDEIARLIYRHARERIKTDDDWKRENGRYVPSLGMFIEDHRWTDGIPKEVIR